MEKPEYLSKFLFDWEVFDVLVAGKSALDSRDYILELKDRDDVHHFLNYYGLGQKDPVLRAELFGMFQESLQFIKRYFLFEGNPEGIKLEVPSIFSTITSTSELFLMASRNQTKVTEEERQWSIIFLKIMHTLVHVDKDLRHNYFPVIQQQIFDRFYKHLFRDKNNQLFIGSENDPNSVPLFDFHTKAKKTRDSIVLKLLHKVEHVAEELFDRVGVRFVTKSKCDILRVIKFLYESHIVIPNNIIPSRSYNTLLNLDEFRKMYEEIYMGAGPGLPESEFYELLSRAADNSVLSEKDITSRNNYSLKKFRSVQFTCRQLIRFQDPFVFEFSNLRNEAKGILERDPGNDLAQKIVAVDNSNMPKNIRFFYPYEVQIVDQETHETNSIGEASHKEYKMQQLKSSIRRLFRSLIELKNLDY